MKQNKYLLKKNSFFVHMPMQNEERRLAPVTRLVIVAGIGL